MSKMRFLEGKHLYLRPLDIIDAEGCYPQWLNDQDVCVGNSHHIYPYSSSDAVEYIQSLSGRRDAIVLAIVTKERNEHIGNIALQQINLINRTADLAILLGEKSCWGKGYGLEASSLMVSHGFLSLNLNRITCATFETNNSMKNLALKLGMKQEGVRRQAVYKSGRYVDIVEFGLLRADF